jgi:hypothetical protein
MKVRAAVCDGCEAFCAGRDRLKPIVVIACMDDFVITRSWVLEHMTRCELAEQVTLSGDQMRALLAAAYNGLRPVLASERPLSVVELAARRGPV